MATMRADTQEHAVTRNTIQRALVLETVQSLRNHPSSAEIYEAVRQKHPSISRATVYRNLNTLTACKKILHIEVPNGADRYDFNNEPHYHARCRVCGGVFDVEMPYLNDLNTRITNTQGFIIEGHDIVFNGICAACRENHMEAI